ncbi:translocation protein [Piedraia hortae CBS 480.64]|uniref:Translocation protein SEC62 n=1 Tax=Piedraia hortae CBS 480.64 TaxID=1314780 RepID=A0A6A7C254_9PEZI|nr:translocation protein [Piedraia hortae CBS 480.64]
MEMLGAVPRGPGGPVMMQPGNQPSPQQVQMMREQLVKEAERAGLSPEEYFSRMRQHAMQQQQMRDQAHQGGSFQGQPQRPQQGPPNTLNEQATPGNGPPTPESIAVARFLRGQNLKMRTCIFQDKRKDMFRVKRAIRALQSDEYVKARKKNKLLPEVNDRVTAENTFKLLPMSLLALRVRKVEQPDGGGKKKRVKGLWTVVIEPQQEAHDDMYYVMLYEGSQWRTRLQAAGALLLILALVFFPMWPYTLRLGVWYLSMGALGLLGVFFVIAVIRAILYLITMFTAPPGLWLFPNLFEDVGFFDSFRPLYAWHEDEKAVKKRKKAEREQKKLRRAEREKAKTKGKQPAVHVHGPQCNHNNNHEETHHHTQEPMQAEASQPETGKGTGFASEGNARQRNLGARVEEVEE